MRLRMKRMLLAVLAAAMSLVLSGCFVKTVDELYTLPKHSDEYNRLEQAIDQVMSSQNASYAAPVSGMNQQSVQLADLDGDGTEEVVAFLKTTGDKPLKACIFSRVDEDYQLMDVIEGDGTSFASVEYVPLTGGPGVELVIGRQLSTDVLQSLCAYSYTGGHVVELLSTNYSEYRCVDLDEDGGRICSSSALTRSSRRAWPSSTLAGRPDGARAGGVSDSRARRRSSALCPVI